nr:MAG TPA: SITE SPECIFIC RECOMBINASE XERD [Caudoviricetes sp.]
MIKAYVDYMVGEQKSGNTITAYSKDVQQMLDCIGKPEASITYADLLSWKSGISGMASASVNRKIVAVSGYFKFLHDVEIIKSNPAVNLKSVKVHNKEKLPMSREDIAKMLNACKSNRQKAMLYTLGATGLRVSELTGLGYKQYRDRVGNQLVITGKGNKQRVVFLNPETVEAINLYIRTERKANRWAADCDYLFASSQGGKVDANNFDKTLKALARKAGIKNADEVSAHTFRHSFACILSENGTSMDVIRDLLGHSSLAVTSRYLNKNVNRMREATMAISF